MITSGYYLVFLFLSPLASIIKKHGVICYKRCFQERYSVWMFECTCVSCGYIGKFSNFVAWHLDFSILSLLGQFFSAQRAAIFVILFWTLEQNPAILLIWVSPSPRISGHPSDILNSTCYGNCDGVMHIWNPQTNKLIYLFNNSVSSLIKSIARGTNRVSLNFVPKHLV